MGFSFTEDERLLGTRIASAVQKYAGGTSAVNKLLGIEVDRTRKWPKEKIIEGYRNIIGEYGITPNQLIYDHRNKKIELPEAVYRELGQLIDVANREFGGSKNILEMLNFKAPSRKRKKKVFKPKKITS